MPSAQAADLSARFSRRRLSTAIRCAVFAGCMVSAAQAQPVFESKVIDTNANGARSVFATDVDGDGDTDVLSASFNDDKIAWYENDGNGSFTLHTIATNADYAFSVFAADVDGDGDTDVFSASISDDKIAWYENDGSQNFALRTIATNANGAISVFATDVDGDGDTDVLSASQVDDKIAWYENDGNGSFTLHTIATNADNAWSVFAADVDGDGDTDVLSASFNDDKIAWYENDGSQNFTLRTIATNADGASSVFAADVDGDGDTDVLSASRFDAKIAWYENDGGVAPTFTLRTIATNADGATSVFAADVDGDGDTDVLSASYGDDKIAWYENDGSEGFTLRTIAVNADSAYSVFAADVDGDGDVDVLSVSNYDDKIAWYDNDARDAFAPISGVQTIATNADNARSIFAADVDGDGDTDVLSASANDDKIAWYENDGSQGFTLHTIAVNADSARSVFATDVDGDGDTDVLSASQVDGKIAWYENDGNGSFTLHTIATNADGAYSVFAADVDGDGDTDVLSASRFDDKIAWYENDGSQGFTLHTIDVNADSANSVFAVDVDGDGDIDVLSASIFDDKIAWYENDGSELFTLRTIVTNALGARSVFAADVDGDGDTDVLSASTFDDKIAWYDNDGSQNFTLRTIATNANGAISVFATDVDGDGDTDVLSASFNDDKIAWYENDGSQNFTLRTIAVNADSAVSVFAADVDGDGDTDVLSASFNDDKIAWYENDVIHRSGAFDSVLTIATNANGATSVFATDVDGDGDTDVLSASDPDDKIAWYDNDGNGSFTLRTIATNANGALSLFASDVDGDGDTDVLSASFIDNKIAWYENDGSEVFTLRTIAANANGATSVFAADVDGDGDTDVLSASLFDDKIAWYENDGSEVFTLRTIAANANGARSVFAADVDGDGDTDVLSASQGDDKIAWYENDGNESFTLRTIATNADRAWSVFAADVDGDGDVDVLSASIYDDKIAWYDNDGSQGFTLRTIATNAYGASSVFAADVDGDGDTDVLSASNYDDKIAWYDNDGSQNFTLRTIVTNADRAFSVFAVDVDGDGDTDVLSASFTDDKIAWYPNCGGQFLFSGQALNPISAAENQTIGVLTLDYLHNGRSGDSSANLDSVALRLSDADGNALGSAQARGFLDDLRIYRDDGDGSFDAGSDTLLNTETLLDLTPAALVNGTLEIDLADTDVVLTPGGSAQLFVAATLAPGSANQALSAFQVGLNQIPLPRPQSQDDASASVLSLECAMNIPGTLVTPTKPTVDLSVDVNAGSEADQTVVTLTATTEAPVSGQQTVDVTVSGTGVTAGDYSLSAATITIADGQTVGTETFTIQDDGLLESAETATLTIGNPSSGMLLGTNLSEDIAITDNDTASLAIDDVSVNEADGTATFTVTLTGDVQDGLSVDYATADDSAVAGSDYTAASGTLNFAGNSGETQSFTVDITDDALLDDGEQFFANLSSPSNGVTLADAQGAATITDNDTASLAIDDVSVDEADGTATFTVTLTGDVQGGLSVDYATGDASAVAGSDYTAASGTLNFAGSSGETQSFTVDITDDGLLEGSEQFLANLSSPSNGVTLADAQGAATITDNDAASLSIDDVSVNEADGTATFTVTLTGDVQGGLSVDYATADGSAAAGSDYTAASGTLNFAGSSGETQSFTVAITDDGLLEGSEQFFANLSSPSNAVTLADAQGAATITDNDTASLAIDDVSVNEADGTATFTVTLTGGVQGGLSVQYATADASAAAGSDYTAASGTLNFAGNSGENQSFTVDITDDGLLEGSEQFFVNLSSPTNGVTVSDTQGIATISDNDAAGLSLDDVAVDEANGTATFTVSLSGMAQGGVTVDATTVDDTAVAGSDYTANAQTLAFAGTNGERQTFTVAITDDAEAEPSEQFFVTLSNASNQVAITDVLGRATITDNDTASLAIDDVSVDEADGTATFTVTLTGGVQGGLSVQYATADASAAAGSDYTAASGTLNFAGSSGETQSFTVDITDDAEAESSEQFFVTLSNASNQATISDAQGVGTINPSDRTGVIFSDRFEP